MMKYFDTNIMLTTVQLIVVTVNCSNRLLMILSFVIVLKNKRAYLVNNPVKQSPKERLCHCISGSNRLKWKNVITYSNWSFSLNLLLSRFVTYSTSKITMSHLVSKAGDSTTTRSRRGHNHKATRVLYINYTNDCTPFSHPSVLLQ